MNSTVTGDREDHFCCLKPFCLTYRTSGNTVFIIYIIFTRELESAHG